MKSYVFPQYFHNGHYSDLATANPTPTGYPKWKFEVAGVCWIVVTSSDGV